MLSLILGWLTGAFPAIGKIIVDAYKARLDATSTIDQHTIDLAARELAVEQREQELKTSLLVAEQGRWWTACWRPLLAFPVVVYINKVVVWDTILGWGTTPAVHGEVANWMGLIISAYVLGRSAEKITAILKRK